MHAGALQEAEAGKSRPARLHRETLPPQINRQIYKIKLRSLLHTLAMNLVNRILTVPAVVAVATMTSLFLGLTQLLLNFMNYP